jgi:leucyl aminopeptidase (aminopeptidase T)
MDKIKDVAKILVNDVFAIKKNEKLIITVDKGSERHVMSEVISEAHRNGAKAVIVEIPDPSGPCSGVNDFVNEDVRQLLLDTNCWLDAGSKPWIYSEPFEQAFAKNENLRYMVIGGIPAEGMMKLFGNLDVNALKAQANKMKSIISKGSKMTFKCDNGTSFEATLNHEHVLASDIGDASVPGFHTPPALLNIVPTFGQVNGVFSVTALMIDENWTVLDMPLHIHMRDSKIVDLKGDETHINKLNEWLDKGDDASRLFAHLSIGLSPNIKNIQGDVLYDERIDGALNCGFGHVSPIDAPPVGQASSTHFDAITKNISIWVDDTPLMINGVLQLKES